MARSVHTNANADGTTADSEDKLGSGYTSDIHMSNVMEGVRLMIEPDRLQQTCHTINLFTETPPGGQIAAVDSEKVWIKIGIAVDSGACAHVTPANLFATTTDETAASKSGRDHDGADANPIKNLGSQLVNGRDEDGNRVQLKFDVASKLTRPLASVWEIVEGDNEVAFKKGHGLLSNSQGKKTHFDVKTSSGFLMYGSKYQKLQLRRSAWYGGCRV